ncbi:MAG: hypothetical protein IPO15_17085 [Anaerolineae bacterium]|uniref:hypothetical protein n=1 Tax=Candidatus Amarolinea dominans TaxID=3140696 RepID=UPI003135BD98|nr:hypothetical protein [Anaerolineae bacterium]
MLEDGQRTGLWLSRQPVVRKFYPHPAQQILFFYVNVGGEIGRAVKVPQWVADDAGLSTGFMRWSWISVAGRLLSPALVEGARTGRHRHGRPPIGRTTAGSRLAQQQIYVARSLKDRSKSGRSI